MTYPITIARIEAFAFRSPIEKPIETSFGVMHNRPATFVRIEDKDGNFGWGEVFANWPAAAAEHRVNLIAQDIAPIVFERPLSHPDELFEILTARTHVIALQSGEWGPFRQAIAGLDIALWDLFARKNRQTLRHFINPEASDTVPAYASGIHIKDAMTLITKARKIGFESFKIKVGFDLQDDLTRLIQVFKTMPKKQTIAVDANQAWKCKTALSFIEHTRSLPLTWLEEPISADDSLEDLTTLVQACPYPLAGGENLVGFHEFETAISTKYLQVLQPDIIKWGGISGCLKIGRAVCRANLLYCPHFLGGGIGLQASANLLAAVGGSGLLEVDVNPNPLRDVFAPINTNISQNKWKCNQTLGIGVTHLPESLKPLLSHHAEILA